ncbi:MAG: DNA recombination protein RmuC, partial [Thalassolituus sp.]
MTDSLITSFLMSPVGMLTLILVASVASAALGWLLRDRRASTVNAELALVQDENLRLRDQAQVQHESLSQFKDELEQSRNQISALQLESARQQEQLNAAQLREASLQQRLDESVRQVSELQTESQSVRNQLVKEQETRVQQERSAEEKLALLNESRENLLKDFENLSQKIFEQKTKQFSEQSQQGISSLLTPFREQLDGLKKKVEDVYVSDTRDRASLKAQIGELHKLNQQITAEAHALTIALKGEKKKQGNGGELVLETVLEKSGLREGEEFVR